MELLGAFFSFDMQVPCVDIDDARQADIFSESKHLGLEC